MSEYPPLPPETRYLANRYMRGERTPEARAAWAHYRRDRERVRWARIRAETGLSKYAYQRLTPAEREALRG